MKQTYHLSVFRLFVSSTFGDMKRERELLQERVFPALQTHCKAKGAMFQAVDLRWGVSEEAALDQQAMNICLREVERCQEATDRPNFLVLLGDRYGWRPLPPQIEADELQELLDALNNNEAERNRIKSWYQRDDNSVPVQFLLKPRTGEFEKFERWEAEERALRDSLLKAIKLCGWSKDDARRAKYEQSATHQEIQAGALNSSEDNVLACFRTIKDRENASSGLVDRHPDGTLDEESSKHLGELQSELSDRLERERCFKYDAAHSDDEVNFDEGAFVDRVKSSLFEIIDAELDAAVQSDALDLENLEHEAFGEERSTHFVGQTELLGKIHEYIESPESEQSPFIVHGVSGSGKTALMGRAFELSKCGPDEKSTATKNRQLTLARFIGATPDSTNLRSLLTELCQQIHRAFEFEKLRAEEERAISTGSVEARSEEMERIGRKYTIPDDLNKLIEYFRELLARIPEQERLVLFLDALDQLDETGSPHRLNWLPERLPSNVRIILSVLKRPDEAAGRAFKTARERFADRLYEVAPLSSDNAGHLFEQWLKDAGRTLQEEQRKVVMAAYEAQEVPLPLWLKLVFEDAKTWRSWDVAPDLPCEVSDLLKLFFDKLEAPARHGENLVSTVLGHLAAARNGLTDDEILDVVAQDDDYWKHFESAVRNEHSIPARRLPPVMWMRLQGDLSFALAERRADDVVLNTFYHRQIAEFVTSRYLNPKVRETHSQLGDYFNRQEHYIGDTEKSPNRRKLSELVEHYIKSDRWEALLGDEMKIAPLSDLFFIQAKCEAGLVYELMADYNRVLEALPELSEENDCLQKRDAAMIAYNKTLKAYAVDRYEWFRSMEQRDQQVEPLYPKLPDELKAENPVLVTEETSLRAVRLRHFANFVSANITPLGSHPEGTFPLAYNWAESGPIAARAEQQQCEYDKPWLRRSPRPSAPPLKPQCKCVFDQYGNTDHCALIISDGQLMVSGGKDGALRLWDLKTGLNLRTFQGHRKVVWSLSATEDGSRLVSASWDRTLRIWDLEKGQCLHVLEGHSAMVDIVKIAPNNKHVISGSKDRTCRLWDIESGKCLHVFDEHNECIRNVAISPDSRRMISSDGSESLKIWDLKSAECLHTSVGHKDRIYDFRITFDGRRAISASQDCSIRVWDIDSGESILTLTGHTDRVSGVWLTPDGCRAVSASRDGSLRLWDLESGKLLFVFKSGSADDVSVCISPDGRRVIWNGYDSLYVGDLESGECLRKIETPGINLDCLMMAPNGRDVLSNGMYDAIRVWDTESADSQPAPKKHSDWVEDITISPDYRFVISASHDNTLCLWDSSSGKLIRSLEGHSDVVDKVIIGFTQKGLRAVSASRDKTLRVWGLEHEECLETLKSHESFVNDVAMTADGNLVISVSHDKNLLLWDLNSGRCLCKLEGHDKEINSVSVTHDGRYAVSASWDASLRLWALEDGRCVHILRGHEERVNAVCLTPDERYVVSASHDKTLRLWNLARGNCLRVLKGHESGIYSVSVTDDGRCAFSASYDGTCRVWDLLTGNCLHIIDEDCDRSYSVSLASDGEQVALTTWNRTLSIWNTNSWCRFVRYHAQENITNVSMSAGCEKVVCATQDGQVHCLTPMNFPNEGPTVLTVFHQSVADSGGNLDSSHPFARCKHCNECFKPNEDVLDSINEYSKHDNLNSDIFESSRLKATCPNCGILLKFNPFFVHRNEH